MRSIIRLFKGAGILNLLGMTVAFAAIYIIMVQVNYDWNYNSKIKDVDRIFILAYPHWIENDKYEVIICRPYAERIINQSAGVEAYGIFNGCYRTSVSVNKKDIIKTFDVGIAKMTSGSLKVFGFQALTGTFDNIGKEATVALSEKTAKRLGLSIGDILELKDEGIERSVVAIYKDMPINSSLKEAELVYCNTCETYNLDNTSEWSYKYFIKLKSRDDIDELNRIGASIGREILKEEIESLPAEERLSGNEIKTSEDKYAIKFFPLKGIHFNKNIYFDQINQTTTITLFIVATLILIITLINFTNFFMAQVPVNLRSVNTKKILGCSRLSIVIGFMLKTALLVVISLILSCCAVILFKGSTYANLINSPLDFEYNIPVALVTALLVFIMTLMTSIYPAMYTTSFSPAIAIKGTLGTVQKGKNFRYALIVLQFMISIGFMLCASFIKTQYDFMMNYDMGFDKESLFTANVPATSVNRELYTHKLKEQTVVKDIAWGASPLVALNRMEWGRNNGDGKDMYFTCYPVSYNFLDFMGIKVMEGRDFTKSDEKCETGIYIFNQEAKSRYNLKINEKAEGHLGNTDIAGFCENFRFKSLHFPVEPFAFYVFGKKPWWTPTHLYIRNNPGASYKDVMNALKETVSSISPDYNPEEVTLKFFDEELGTQYEKEQQLIKLVDIFTALAISISLIGIIGLLMFETKFRRKEIGLRRIHGASIPEILKLLNKKYIYLLIIGFIIATPLSYLIMDYYYSTFVNHSTLHWWVFILAFVVVVIITAGVVTACSYKAASENPAETLKNE